MVFQPIESLAVENSPNYEGGELTFDFFYYFPAPGGHLKFTHSYRRGHYLLKVYSPIGKHLLNEEIPDNDLNLEVQKWISFYNRHRGDWEKMEKHIR